MKMSEKLPIALAFLVLMLCISGVVVAQEKPWELAKSGDGIEVFTRESKGGKIKEYKAVMEVKTTIKALETLLDDIGQYHEWQENCSEAIRIKEISKNKRIEHYFTDTPWPIADRDVVYDVNKITNENGTLVYKLTCAPDAVPVSDDYIRIKESEGQWTFEPLKNGSIRISQQFYADPGGSIPTWLINSFLVTGPYNSMVNMRERL